MSIRKRALALVLALVLLVGLLPIGVSATGSGYQDVSDGHWANSYIQRVTQEGLMNGTSQTTFSPNATVTRGMFVTILARFAGVQVDNEALTRFDDVPSGTYYTGAVAWASENGIVSGMTDTTFCPKDFVTREQMATLLYRAMLALGYTSGQTGDLSAFTDGDRVRNYAKEAMSWAVGAGLLNGFKDGSLRPGDTATRAQAAKVFCLLLDYTDQPVTPTEPETGFTVTFLGDGGYAKVDGEKVSSVTLEPGVDWLSFNLYGDQSQGFDLDQVAASAGTLERVKSEFILRDIDQDVTVSFTTKGKIVTVTFVSRQVATIAPETVQVPWGQTIQEPDAVRTGYTIAGWKTEEGERFDFSQPVYEDVTLYADWKVQTFTVSYYDGETLLMTQKVEYGGKIERPDTPAKEGYLLVGWFLDPELTQVFDFYDRCRSDMNLYAKWREDDRADYIYLDGEAGDDDNDGTSDTAAVKTFERAKALLAGSKNPVILISGMVTITEDTTWSMADLPGGMVARAPQYTKRMVTVQPEAEDASATLTLEDIIIDGGATMWPELLTQRTVWFMLDVESGGRLVLNSGAVLQNSAATASMVGGAAYITGSGFNPGTFEMNEGAKVINNYGGYIAGIAGSAGAHITVNGGLISGNKAMNTSTTLPHRGSALSVSSGDTNNPGVLTINGGVIENNESLCGGAVGLAQHAVGYLNGGVIRNNTSATYGGLIAYGNSGSSTWYLNGGTVKNNTPGRGYSDDQVALVEKSKVVFGADKDALKIEGVFVDTAKFASAIGVSKPLSNVQGGGIDVTLSYLGIETVLATGEGTYKLTAADTQAYRLSNSLEPYYRAELDSVNNRYSVASTQVIGAEVYMNDSTMRVNPGNDANDGLTPETPVATFARAKEILKANAKDTGDNIIYVLNGGTIAAGTDEVWSLEGIPNAILARSTTGGIGAAVYVEGNLTLENITIDGLCMYTSQSRTTSAFVRVDEGGTLTVKAGTVVRNMRVGGSGQTFVWSFARAGSVNTVNVEDVTVQDCQAYVTSNNETNGGSIFAMYGAGGESVLNIENGTFVNNQARLVYVQGNAKHTVNVRNCTFSGNSVKGAGAIFLMDQTNAGNATTLNVYGGTFTDNHCLLTSPSYSAGAIARIKSSGSFHLYGGTFEGNTSAAGDAYNGIYLRDVSNKIGSTVYLHTMTCDMPVYYYPCSKKIFNSRIITDKALSHTLSVYFTDKNVVDGMAIVAGTEDYALTEADLAKVVSANPLGMFYLDTEKNAICLKKA